MGFEPQVGLTSSLLNNAIILLQGELDGTILPTLSHTTRLRHDYNTNRVVQINLSHRYDRHARVNGAKSCHRPVVSLSHARKLYRVNRPYEVVVNGALLIIIISIRNFSFALGSLVLFLLHKNRKLFPMALRSG